MSEPLADDLEAACLAWRELRATGGPRVTILRLYELVAEARGVRPEDLPIDERRALAERAWTAIWPGFELLPEASLPRHPIVIVPYDPSWPDRYETWRARLAQALGPIARRIDHVGSTSVPGLAAKPIVDIQVSVDDLRNEPSYIPECEALGLQLRSRDDEHRYMRPRAGTPRDVHLHVCQVGTDWERVHLLFRDYLRLSDGARESYLAAKLRAVAAWADDGGAYTEAKSDAILDILDEAEKWAAAIRWALPPLA